MKKKCLLVFVAIFFFTGLKAQDKSYKFSFGAKKSGNTHVSPQTIYSDEVGYGFDFGTLPNFVENPELKGLAKNYISSKKPFYFSVSVPEGNYKVKVLLGNPDGKSNTTIKAESRRLMLENAEIKQGKFKEEVFIVNIKDRNISEGKKVSLKPRELSKLDWDNKLTLEFNNISCVASIEITPVDNVTTVFLAGNSTVVNQDNEPWASWGQMIPNFFDTHVAIANHAESGLTLGSFKGSHRLEKILSVMKKGDYLFIEFGHNDQKEKGPDDGAYKSYTERLKYFVNSCREKQGIPVIVTSTSRRAFSSGKVVETLGDYPDAARKVAAELHVPLIDLNAATKLFYEALGEDASKKAFVHYAANTYPDQTQALADNTHFNPYGAYEISKIILQGIIDNKISLKKYIKNFNGFDASQPDDLQKWQWPESLRSNIVKPDGN